MFISRTAASYGALVASRTRVVRLLRQGEQGGILIEHYRLRVG